MTARRILAAALAGVWLLGCDTPGAGPILQEGEHRFGTVVHGQKVEHTWLLSAAVPRAFVVSYVRVPCSCALPSLIATAPGGARRAVGFDPKEYPFPVAAGERLELQLVFDSNQKLAKDWDESFQTVVYTDLPGQAEVRFKFQASIQVPLLVTPGPEINLGGLADKQTAVTALTLAPRDGRRFQVRGVAGDPRTGDLTGLTFTTTTDDTGVHRYRIESPPGRSWDEAGNFLRIVRFKTDLPGDYELEVQVRAKRIAAVTIEPTAQVSFGRVTPGQPAEQSVTLHQNVPGELLTASLDRIELKVEDQAVAAGDHFSVRFEPIPQVHAVRMTLRYQEPLQGRYFRGKIHLKTNLPDTPTLYVDMVGFHDR